MNKKFIGIGLIVCLIGLFFLMLSFKYSYTPWIYSVLGFPFPNVTKCPEVIKVVSWSSSTTEIGSYPIITITIYNDADFPLKFEGGKLYRSDTKEVIESIVTVATEIPNINAHGTKTFIFNPENLIPSSKKELMRIMPAPIGLPLGFELTYRRPNVPEYPAVLRYEFNVLEKEKIVPTTPTTTLPIIPTSTTITTTLWDVIKNILCQFIGIFGFRC